MSVCLFAVCFTLCLSVVQAPSPPAHTDDISVAAFNIQIFGQHKAKKAKVMDVLAKIMVLYDVILIQEIREKDNTAITALMDRIASNGGAQPRAHVISDRLGRSTSKEQYAFIYNTERLQKVDTYHYVDADNNFERPPYTAIFKPHNPVGDHFALIGIHVKPSDATNEINNLTRVYDKVVNKYSLKEAIILGDLNADCAYIRDWKYVTMRQNKTFDWLIADSDDTTVSGSDCAYDRFIIAGDKLKEAVIPNSVGVFKFDVAYGLNSSTDPTPVEVSDHYPIELKMRRLSQALQDLSAGSKALSSWTIQLVLISVVFLHLHTT